MTAQSKLNGHEVIIINDEWLYKDDKTPTVNNDRACGNCNKEKIIDGFEEYDGCIGKLSGNVMNACCGHGDEDDAYVQFNDESRISGAEAIEFMNKQKGSK